MQIDRLFIAGVVLAIRLSVSADAVGAGIGGVTDAFVQRFYLTAGVAGVFGVHFTEFSFFAFIGEVEECGGALGRCGEAEIEI